MTTQEKMALWGNVLAAVVSGYAANPNHEQKPLGIADWVKDGANAADEAVKIAEETERKMKEPPPPSHFTHNADADF